MADLKGLYAGVITNAPIYEGTIEYVSTAFNNTTYTQFFNVDDPRYAYSISSTGSDSGGISIGVSSTTGSLSFTALVDMTNIILTTKKSYSGSQPTVILNGETLTETSSSGFLIKTYTYEIETLSIGDILTYFSDNTDSSYNATITMDNVDLPVDNRVIVGYEDKELARQVSKIWSNGPEEGTNIPIYRTETTDYNLSDYDKIFIIDESNNNGAFTFLTTSSSPTKIYSSYANTNTGSIIFTANTYISELNAYIGPDAEPTGNRKYTISKNGNLLSASQGEDYLWHWDSFSMNAGDKIEIKKVNGTTTVGWNLYLNMPNPATISTQVLDHYETKYLARQILKGYIGINNIAKQFWGALPFNYTGLFTQEIIADNSSKLYRLYTLQTSGDLILLNDDAKIWICGGGGKGGKYAVKTASSNGGGGGYFQQAALNSGAYTIVIGAGGTSIERGGTSYCESEIIAEGGYSGSGTTNAGEGESGGGLGHGATTSVTYGKGSGKNTVPFAITSLKPHCAGGAGGNYMQGGVNGDDGYSHTVLTIGGDGGTKGGNGSLATEKWDTYDDYYYNGVGGNYGGGTGGRYNAKGENAFFYGAGGGGGGSNIVESNSWICYEGGIGYQGVAYILIPV